MNLVVEDPGLDAGVLIHDAASHRSAGSSLGRSPEALQHRPQPVAPALEVPAVGGVVRVRDLRAEILDDRVQHLSEDLKVAVVKFESHGRSHSFTMVPPKQAGGPTHRGHNFPSTAWGRPPPDSEGLLTAPSGAGGMDALTD